MDIFYRRDTRKSYMIAQGLLREESFEDEMLKNNEISCILPFRTVENNDEIQVWYEISGMRSLQDLVDEAGHITAEMLYDLFGGLEKAYREMSRYLISGSSIYLSAETIYAPRSEGMSNLKLCYMPLTHEDTEEGTLLTVMEYLITMTDHREKEVTQLCYDLYEKAQSGETDAGKLKYMVSGYLNRNTESAAGLENQNAKGYDEDPFIPDWEPLPAPKSGEKAANEFQRNEVQYEQVEPFDHAGVQELPEYAPAVIGGTIAIEPQRSGSRGKFLPDVSRAVGRLMEKIRFGSIKKSVRRGNKDGSVLSGQLMFDEVETAEDEDVTTLLIQPVEMEPRMKEPPKGLLIYGGEGEQDSFTIETELFTLGSGKNNDGVIGSGHVSRRHGKVHHDLQTGEYWIEDLNSLNGTVINGSYIPPHKKCPIYAGDQVSFAGMNFTVR